MFDPIEDFYTWTILGMCALIWVGILLVLFGG